MRSAPLLLAALLVPALALAPSCRRHEEPPPPPPTKPASIWTATDAQAIAKQLVETAAQATWTGQFRDRNQRPARIALGSIEDRSGHDVAIDALAAAITQALGELGGDRLVVAGSGEADFTLGGTIGAANGTGSDGAPAVFFAIDLTFVHISSGDKVWPFAIEREVRQR